jgi:potassium efflux system protein
VKAAFRFLLVTLCVFINDYAGQAVWAAPPESGTEDLPVITQAQIEAKIKKIEAAKDIEEAQKTKVIELYRKAQSTLETARSHSEAAKAFKHARETAPDEAAQIRDQLEQRRPQSPTLKSLAVSDVTPLADLEQRFIKEQANLAASNAKLDQIDEKLNQENARPNTVRERLTEIKRNQQEISAELRLPPPTGESPQKTEARRLLLQVRKRALDAEVHMLDQELLSQGARISLLRAQRDQTAHNVSEVDARTKLLEGLINQRRRAEAEKVQAETEEAKLEAAGKHMLIQNLAERNAHLSQELAALTVSLERLTKTKEAIEKNTNQLEHDFESIQQKIKIAGLSQVLGKILVDRRDNLRNLNKYRFAAAKREDIIAEAGLRQLQHTEERRTLTDIEAILNQLTEPLKTEEIPEEKKELIKAEARNLLKERRELLDRASAMDVTYLRELGNLEFAERRLFGIAQDFKQFLDEHLLWVPSVPPISLSTLLTLPKGMIWLLSPNNWMEVVRVLSQDSIMTTVTLIVAIGLVTLFVGQKSRLKRSLESMANKVGKLTADRFSYTLQALGVTILLAIPWPLFMTALGWRLQISDNAAFAVAVGKGFVSAAGSLFNLLVFRELCRPKGVAHIHFNWSGQALDTLRHHLDWFIVLAVPAAFIAVIAYTHVEGTYMDSLSRVAYFVIMFGLAYLFFKTVNPKGSVLKTIIAQHPSGWLSKFRYVWFPLTVLTPLALVLLAAVGYFYTAGMLTKSLINTIWLVLGIVIVRDVALRWLVLTRKKLALQVAMEKRKAIQEARKASEAGQLDGEGGGFSLEEEKIDLATIDAQTRKLLNTLLGFTGAIGMWLIWSAVLPALGYLDQIPLWNTSAVVEGEETVLPITLAGLGLAMLLVIITVVAAKNLPGLLELVFLQRLSLEPSSRYTITTLAQYTIVAIGMVLIFNTIGGNWSQIQWLVAAVGVGLGFGLQEIFGNFVSGLIILFERPVRVGDIVTVGDTTGTVSKIRIRATTITNWDKQELLVPNKEFITSRLLNWTLSDQTNRIVVTVGVAYGSDVKQALQLMAEAAQENEHVLEDPKPILTFEGFGDNALTLIMRCYLSSLEFRIFTISALHESINRKFEEASIVIAFPQRDIHLDTSRPLDVRIHPGNPSPNLPSPSQSNSEI